MKNQTPFALCLLGGLFLILAGYDHGIRTIFLIYGVVHAISALAPYYLIIDSILTILGLIAWSGGYAVILGGGLLTTSHVRLGKFFIMISAGFGLISFILTILWFFIAGGWVGLLFLAWLIMNSIWALGLVLTIIARSMAK
ncbi:MAG: hypothetical protein KGD60_10090 [Candidatus Thorarchaeota archaeon]|nr:hypothetical protein [Candidatus Thorarchaeota archaeon]